MLIKYLPTLLSLTLLSLISTSYAIGQDLQDNSLKSKSKVAICDQQHQHQQQTKESLSSAAGLPDCEYAPDRSRDTSSVSDSGNLHGFINRVDVDLNQGKPTDGGRPIQTSAVSDGNHTLRLALCPFVAPGAFKRWMNDTHPEFARLCKESDPSSLVLTNGNHEKLTTDGHLFGIRCNNIAMRSLDATISGGNCKVLTNVLINDCGCSCRTTLGSPDEIERRTQHVRDFVNNGGYLLLTGHDLGSVEQLFPGFVAITYYGGEAALVDAELVKPDQVIGNRVVTNGLWLLDGNTPSIKVLRPDLVRVICRSKKLAAETPDDQGVLAALFPFGRGYVMCISGSLRNNPAVIYTKTRKFDFDFPNQLPDAAPKIHIAMRQALAGNFIEAGLTHTRIPAN
jgi:hypothetical protein